MPSELFVALEYGAKETFVFVLEHGVKALTYPDGYRYYSAYDMLYTAGAPGTPAILADEIDAAIGKGHTIRSGNKYFYYVDLAGADYLLKHTDTDRAKEVSKAISM
jgi:hypothetical protein